MDYFPGNKTYQLFGEGGAKLPPMIIENARAADLIKYNQQGYGVFMTINETDGKGRAKKNIKKVRAVFADFDGVDPDESGAMDCAPHFLVRSSIGKYHAYWLVDEKFPLRGFKTVQQGIALKFHSDAAVCDLSRVMRVPGFYHRKGNPVPVIIAWKNHDFHKLSYRECSELFPPKPVKKFSAPKFKRRDADKDVPGSSIGCHELLLKYGWKQTGRRNYARPGKNSGISGTLLDFNLFWPFTSSTCLTPDTACDAWELMSQYEYGGDKKRCAKALKEAGK